MRVSYSILFSLLAYTSYSCVWFIRMVCHTLFAERLVDMNAIAKLTFPARLPPESAPMTTSDMTRAEVCHP